MKKLILYVIAIGIIPYFLSSCTSYKKLPYLKKAEQLTAEQLQSTASIYDAKIMPKDILSISVYSETPEAAADFRLSAASAPSNNESSSSSSSSGSSSSSETTSGGDITNYIVDSEGYIDFPVLGKLKLAGLTKKQAEDLIFSLVYPHYLTEKPIIDIRHLNFSVTVLGEVNNPGVYRADNEQMTILDALAMAGDLTIYGKRKNVMLIRTKENGEFSIHRINLQDKNLLLNKDLFYLQQNDKLFVEANRARGNSSNFGEVETLIISLATMLISVGISAATLIQNNNNN